MQNDNSLRRPYVRTTSEANLDDLIDRFNHLSTASTSETRSVEYEEVKTPPMNKMNRKEVKFYLF